MKPRCLFRGYLIGQLDSHLPPPIISGADELEAVLLSIKGHNRVTVRCPVGHRGVRNSAFILDARPPTAANGDIDDVMMRLFPLPALLLTEKEVLMIMLMGRDRERKRTLLNQPKQGLMISRQVQRNVHQQHDHLLCRNRLQIALQPIQLFLSKTTLEAKLSFGCGDIVDVVEHDKMDLAVVKRVVTGTKVPFKGLVDIPAGGGVEIGIVIAEDVVPGNANQTDRLGQRPDHIQIIEGDIAQCHSKGSLGAPGIGNHVVGNVVDLSQIPRLGVPKQNHPKNLRLLLRSQRKVDRLGQRPTRRDSCKTQLRTAAGPMQVIELRELARANSRPISRRLDHKDLPLFAKRQLVSSLIVGPNNFQTVRDPNSGQWQVRRVPPTIPIPVIKHEPLRDAALGRAARRDALLCDALLCDGSGGLALRLYSGRISLIRSSRLGSSPGPRQQKRGGRKHSPTNQAHRWSRNPSVHVPTPIEQTQNDHDRLARCQPQPPRRPQSNFPAAAAVARTHLFDCHG